MEQYGLVFGLLFLALMLLFAALFPAWSHLAIGSITAVAWAVTIWAAAAIERRWG